MKLVADTGPLVAAVNRRDPDHDLAAGLITGLGRNLLVLDVVAAEADSLLRSRCGDPAARALLNALANEEHTPVFLSSGLLKRATEFDRRYAALNLGLVDGSVMAYAERHGLAVLTFDLRDFRATKPRDGHWVLPVSEQDLWRAQG